MTNPPRPGSPACFVPSAFRSWNFRPEIETFSKLPKFTSAGEEPELNVRDCSQSAAATGMPPTPAFGVEQLQPPCWTSRTAYVPGLTPEIVYVPPATVVASGSPASLVLLP